MAFATLPVDAFSVQEIGEGVPVGVVDRMATDASNGLRGIVSRATMVGAHGPARSSRMSEARMAVSTGLGRKFERHALRLLEVADRITNAVASGKQFDRPALEQAGAAMTIDATKRRILPLLHPTAAMYPRQILRNDAIEAISNFEMKRGFIR